MSNLSAGSSDSEIKNPEEDKFEEDKTSPSVQIDPKSINIDQLFKKYSLKNSIDL
jgi:hypothetical protein